MSDNHRGHDDLLFDLLIPGDAQWPSASQALDETTAIALRHLLTAQPIASLMIEVQTLDSAARVERLKRFRHEEPALFDQIYETVLTAYYSSPGVAEQTRRLSNAGPRETSRHFYPELLDSVIATAAGRRRL